MTFPRPRRGFTLLEILVVIMIVAILMRIGLGVLGSLAAKNQLEATTQAVRAVLRRARNASQEERFGAVVTIDRERGQVRAQMREAITRFRFDLPPLAVDEDEREEVPETFEVTGARGFSARVVQGELIGNPKGRAGEGLLFYEDQAYALIEDRPILSPLEGIHVSCWIYLGVLGDKLEERADEPSRRVIEEALAIAGEAPRVGGVRDVEYEFEDPPLFNIVRKGKAYALGVTADYEVELGLSGVRQDGVEVTYISRTRPGTLRPDRWYRLELAYDGRRARVTVDGIDRQHLAIPGFESLPARLIRDTSPVVLSDPDPRRDLFGVIDELELAAVVHSEAVEIPAEVVLVAPEPEIHFDMVGALDPASHNEALIFYLSDAVEALEAYTSVVAASPDRTMTRAEAEEAKRVIDDREGFQRFVERIGALPPQRVQRVYVERTGLVR